MRNAAEKAFQAWRAVLAALLRLEMDKLLQKAKTEVEKRWLVEKAVLGASTTEIVVLSQVLADVGYAGSLQSTALALVLRDYRYHGPAPDVALSKFRNRQEVAVAALVLLKEVVARVEQLEPRVGCGAELEEVLRALRVELAGGKSDTSVGQRERQVSPSRAEPSVGF